jgi:hypothetical protein
MGISKKFRRISGPFSKPNIHSMGHWWKLNWLQMPSRQSSVCKAPHMIVADVTFVKHRDLQKYALRNTNITWHRVCLKNQNSHNMCVKKATKYAGMKQRSCRFKQTLHTENTRNLSTCLW